MCCFATRSSYNASIMVLLKLTFVFFVLHSFLHFRVGEDLRYLRYGFGASAVPVSAWNVAKVFEDLEAKPSVVIKQHTYFYIKNCGASSDDRLQTFRLRYGWIA